MRFIDLSQPLENNPYADPPGFGPEIVYQTHQDTADCMISFFPGLTKSELPGGQGWAIEQIRLNTHNGTHMDAPYHYHSTMDGGKRAITIDEVPLDWCFRPGVKLDFRHFTDGYVATRDDVIEELDRIGHTLQPFDIVVVNTRAGSRYGHEDYVSSGCGMGRDATLFLVEHGVRVTGTDGWSWDAPFVHTKNSYAATGDASLVWEGHRVGMDVGYCHMEKMHNLEALTSRGFMVACFPVKVRGGSAGWTRAVAILGSINEAQVSP